MAEPNEIHIPSPSQQPIAVDFIQNRQATFSSAEMLFDPKTQQFVDWPLARQGSFDLVQTKVGDDQLQATTRNFKFAVADLRKKKGKNDEMLAKFNFDDVENWVDVVATVQKAQSVYLSEDSSTAKVRAKFRKMGDKGNSIQKFVELLPDGEYKTLCGGLTLILTTMNKHSSIRRKMADMLSEFPTIVGDCEDYLEIYKGANVLQTLARELYVNILLAFTEIVKWYSLGTLKRAITSLTNNSNQDDAIDQYAERVQQTQNRIDKVVRLYLHARAHRIDKTSISTKDLAEESQLEIRRLAVEVNNLREGGQRVEREVRSSNADMINSLKDFLIEHTTKAKWQRSFNDLYEDVFEQTAAKPMYDLSKHVRRPYYIENPKWLAKKLNLDLAVKYHVDDIEHAQTEGREQSLRFQTRAKWLLIEDFRFRAWLDSKSSQALFIQGNSEHVVPTSPVSFLVSLLYPRLVQSNNTLTLTFFCGSHADGCWDTSTMPSSMVQLLRSLLQQLLSSRDIDWKTGSHGAPFIALSKKDHVTQMQDGSFSAYLKTFSRLLEALRETHRAIFILIDGLDWYDPRPECGSELGRLIKAVFKLVDEDEEHLGVVKVLFTAGTHSKYFPADDPDVIDMPDNVDCEEDGLEEIL